MSIEADEGEQLENGASASTPNGDNLLLDYTRAHGEGYAELLGANGARTVIDDEHGVHMTDLSSPSPFGNAAMLTAPVANGEATANTIRAFFAAADGGPFLVYSPWPTPDLTAYGLSPVGHPPFMFRSVSDAAAPTTEGLLVERVTDERGLADFERTLIEAYPAPELMPHQRGSILHSSALDTRWHFFVGYLDDEPIATAAAYRADTITVVEQVSTRESARGRGVGAALTYAAATANPAIPSALIASDLGRHTYELLGYLPLLRYTLWVGQRSTS